MSIPLSPPKRSERALTDPSRGALGLVEEWLALSRERDIRLDWHAGQCRVQFPGDESADPIDVPIPRSVLRAALSRIAALCNESHPGSVSPYGGQGEIAIGQAAAIQVRAVFVNTPDEQSLDLASQSR